MNFWSRWLQRSQHQHVDLDVHVTIREESEEPQCQKVKQVLLVTFNNQKFIIMDNLILQLGAGGFPIVAGLVDAATLKPKPEAVPTLVGNTTDNPAIAIIGTDGNAVPVATGLFNLTAVNDWAYTDSVTLKQVTGQRETTIQSCAVVSGPEGVLQVIQLGPPVPIPPPPPAAPPAQG